MTKGSRENNYGVGFEKRYMANHQSREDFQKQKMMVRGEDGEMVECEIVSTRDHESVLAKNAPILPLPFAIICCILNVIPGLGTWVGALLSLCCSSRNPNNLEGSKGKTFCYSILTGLLQLILAPIIVGILWSISYGVMLIRKSLDAKDWPSGDPEQ